MRVLLDNCAPRPLRAFLTGHEVKTAYEMGWASLMNGELLAAAENEFDLLISCDRNLRYQQNLTQRTIRLLILTLGRWPVLKPFGLQIAMIVNNMPERGYAEFP
jgi:hypothetical protein